MLMVVTLHVLLFGMNYYEAHVLTLKGFITNMIEALCYLFLWITILDFLGAGMRLYGLELFYIKKDIAQNKVLLIGLLSGLITFIAKVILVKLTTLLFGHEIYVDIFYFYLSPTVLIEAICLVFYFSKLNIKSSLLLTKVSGATFGVYLIHPTQFFLNDCWKYVTPYKNTPLLVYLGIILASIIAPYSLCTLIEMTRIFVFDKLGIFKTTKKIYSKCQKIIMTFD